MSGITNPAEEYFKDGTWGWDGSAWRKLPMVWGYSDRLIQNVRSLNVPAANLWVILSSPPEGEVWVVTHVAVICDQATVTFIEAMFYDGGAAYPFLAVANPGAYLSSVWTGMIVLKHDDAIHVKYSTPALNDDFNTTMVGYKMKVAE